MSQPRIVEHDGDSQFGDPDAHRRGREAQGENWQGWEVTWDKAPGAWHISLRRKQRCKQRVIQHKDDVHN